MGERVARHGPRWPHGDFDLGGERRRDVRAVPHELRVQWREVLTRAPTKRALYRVPGLERDRVGGRALGGDGEQVLDAFLSGVRRGSGTNYPRHVTGEHHTALARATGDREIRLRVELRVDLDEVHAERDERVHAGGRLGGVPRQQMGNGDVAALEVRA